MLGISPKQLCRPLTKTLLAGSCAFALLGNVANAADLDAVEQKPAPAVKYPLIEGSFVFELESDSIVSDEGDDEFTDTYNTSEVALDVRFNSVFSLHTDITLEAVDNPARGPRTVGEDIFFEDHGFFFETLHLQADFEHFSLYGGKINPSFGSAWDVTPGLYGVDFAEDYEITERIGFGGSYTFKSDSAGEHTFNAATFFADTSGLSRSFGTNRGRTAETDGGASNTESFESVALSLDGGEIEALPGFTYNLGFRFQNAGLGDFGNDTGFVAGATQEIDLNDDITLTLNGEVGYFNNFDGGDADNLYVTVGAGVEYDKWFGDAAFSVRDVSSNVGAGDFTDLQFQAGIGREVFENATLEVGYRYLREENNDSHTIGAIFVYETDFKILRP
ncbi:MAG: hypothetical protein ABJK39_04505 [Hyphomicrobiales bacterium]